MASVWAIGSSVAGSAAVISTCGGSMDFCERRQASVPAPIEMSAKGMIGMPGTKAMTPAAAETMPRLTGFVAS